MTKEKRIKEVKKTLEKKEVVMKKKISMWPIVTICFLIFVFLQTQKAYTQEVEVKHQVISLLVDAVKPATANIKPGTTVIWVNESPGMVEIRFTNTESMILACGSPLRFVQDLQGRFISDMIPFAGVASICFIQKGEFSYAVTRGPRDVEEGKDTTKEYTGKIVVE